MSGKWRCFTNVFSVASRYGAWRVNGILSVARAIGDRKLKTWVIGRPDVEEFDLDGTEDFLLLGCDGLFDVMDHEKIIEFVSTYRAEHDGNVEVSELLCLGLLQY